MGSIKAPALIGCLCFVVSAVAIYVRYQMGEPQAVWFVGLFN